MRKVYLLTILLVLVNYIFFIDSFKGEINSYNGEIEKLNILLGMKEEFDYQKDILELSGMEIIESLEILILKKDLASINRSYSQKIDEYGFRIHEISFVLEGNREKFRKFTIDNVFEEVYKLQEVSIYKDEEKEFLKVSILVRTL